MRSFCEARLFFERKPSLPESLPFWCDSQQRTAIHRLELNTRPMDKFMYFQSRLELTVECHSGRERSVIVFILIGIWCSVRKCHNPRNAGMNINFDQMFTFLVMNKIKWIVDNLAISLSSGQHVKPMRVFCSSDFHVSWQSRYNSELIKSRSWKTELTHGSPC